MLLNPWVLHALLTKSLVLGIKLAFLRALELADGSHGTTALWLGLASVKGGFVSRPARKR